MPKFTVHGSATGRIRGIVNALMPFTPPVQNKKYSKYDDFVDAASYYSDYLPEVEPNPQITTMWDFHEKELELERVLNGSAMFEDMGIMAIYESIQGLNNFKFINHHSGIYVDESGIKYHYNRETGQAIPILSVQLELDIKYKPSLAESIENYKDFYQCKFHRRKKGKRSKHVKR